MRLQEPSHYLRPELVPHPLWGVSANKLLGSAWRRNIRPQVITEADGTGLGRRFRR